MAYLINNHDTVEIEISNSNRAACKKCLNKIAKGALRLKFTKINGGTSIFDVGDGDDFGFGSYDNVGYCHMTCVDPDDLKLKGVEQLRGFGGLEKEKKDSVKKWFSDFVIPTADRKISEKNQYFKIQFAYNASLVDTVKAAINYEHREWKPIEKIWSARKTPTSALGLLKLINEHSFKTSSTAVLEHINQLATQEETFQQILPESVDKELGDYSRTLTPKGDTYVLDFNYDSDLLNLLKLEIPQDQRSYDAKNKNWIVKQKFDTEEDQHKFLRFLQKNHFNIPSNIYQSLKRTPKCYACGKMGHVARQCTENLNSKKRNFSDSFNSKNDYHKKRKMN